MRRTVSYGAAGHMTVLYRYDGMLKVIAAEIMDDDLAVLAELAGKAFSHALSEFKLNIVIHVMYPLSCDTLHKDKLILPK